MATEHDYVVKELTNPDDLRIAILQLHNNEIYSTELQQMEKWCSVETDETHDYKVYMIAEDDEVRGLVVTNEFAFQRKNHRPLYLVYVNIDGYSNKLWEKMFTEIYTIAKTNGNSALVTDSFSLENTEQVKGLEYVGFRADGDGTANGQHFTIYTMEVRPIG